MTESEKLEQIRLAVEEIRVTVARAEERLNGLPCRERGQHIGEIERRVMGLCVNGAEERGVRRGVLIAYGIATALGGGGVVTLLRFWVR